MDKELAHNRERGNSNWFKPCKGVLLCPHDARTRRFSQPIMLDEGVLATTVPNKAQPLRVRLACGESHLGPPGTSLGHSVAEPPELSRLKCAGHHHNGSTSSNALQPEQFLVCRVTSRYNHRFSDWTSIPRTKASQEILQPQVLHHRHKSYYKLVLKHYYKTNFGKTIIQNIRVKLQSFKQRKIKHDGYNTSQKNTRLAQAWYYSLGSLPVEDVSQSTDQLGGKEQG